uniref:Secreted protein n=1 Tax=Meloidogyne floridensis TaxID=298350 RepID=A0A915P601_9BILA
MQFKNYIFILFLFISTTITTTINGRLVPTGSNPLHNAIIDSVTDSITNLLDDLKNFENGFLNNKNDEENYSR